MRSAAALAGRVGRDRGAESGRCWRTTAADAGRRPSRAIGGVCHASKSPVAAASTSTVFGVVADFGRGRCWWSGAEKVRARRRSTADVGLGRGILPRPRASRAWRSRGRRPPVKPWPRRLAKVVEPRVGVDAACCMWREAEHHDAVARAASVAGSQRALEQRSSDTAEFRNNEFGSRPHTRSRSRSAVCAARWRPTRRSPATLASSTTRSSSAPAPPIAAPPSASNSAARLRVVRLFTLVADRWQDCVPPSARRRISVLLLLAIVGAVGLALWSGGGARGVLSKLGVRARRRRLRARRRQPPRVVLADRVAPRHARAAPDAGGFVPPAAALSRAPPEGRRLLEV